MAEEEQKNLAAGRPPVKLQVPGAAGATQHLAQPEASSSGKTATVRLAKITIKKAEPKTAAPSAVPPATASDGIRAGSDSMTMRLKKKPISLKPVAPSATAPAPAVVHPSVSPATPVAAVPEAENGAVQSSASQQTIRLTPQKETVAPATQKIKLTAAAPATPVTPAQPEGSPVSSSQTIKLSPASQTINLSSQHGAVSSSTQKIKLTPASQTMRLTPQSETKGVSSQTIKLAPASQTIKLAPNPVPSVDPAVKASAPGEPANTVKLQRVHMPESASQQKNPAPSAAPSVIMPGAKQTIKLRPSTMGGMAAPPAGSASSAATLNLGGQNRTMKMVPVGNGAGAQVASSSDSPTIRLPHAAAPAEQPVAAASAPDHSSTQQVPVTEQSVTQPASVPPPPPAAGSGGITLKLKPIGGKTMKLSLHKNDNPAAAPSVPNPAASATPPANSQAGQAEASTEKTSDTNAEGMSRKAAIVFLILSSVALLIVIFSVLLMSVQFANMYYGANINIPGMTRLSGMR